MIVELTRDRIADVNKANQPFPLIGRIIPRYEYGKWSYTEELLPEPEEKYYLDDEEDWNLYIDNPIRQSSSAMRMGSVRGRSSCAGTGTAMRLWRIFPLRQNTVAGASERR